MKRTIDIQYDLTDLPKDSRALKDSHAWKADLHQAFAELGWNVKYHGMWSSTNVEQEMLILESEREALDAGVIDKVLDRFGLQCAWARGDGVRSEE